MARFRNDRGMTGESGLSLEELINLKNKAFIDETGDYNELIEKLWFHFSGTNEKITKDYSVFVSYYGEFKGKYSRRLKIQADGFDQPSIIEMTVYPLKDTDPGNRENDLFHRCYPVKR